MAIDVGSYLVVRQVGRAPLSSRACLVVKSCDSCCICAVLDLGDRFYGFVLPINTSGFSLVPRLEFFSSPARRSLAFALEFPGLEGWSVFSATLGGSTVSVAFIRED